MSRDGFLRSAAPICRECGENNQGRTLSDQFLSSSVPVLLKNFNDINPDSRNCPQRRGWTKTEATTDAIKCKQLRCFIANLLLLRTMMTALTISLDFKIQDFSEQGHKETDEEIGRTTRLDEEIRALRLAVENLSKGLQKENPSV